MEELFSFKYTSPSDWKTSHWHFLVRKLEYFRFDGSADILIGVHLISCNFSAALSGQGTEGRVVGKGWGDSP